MYAQTEGRDEVVVVDSRSRTWEGRRERDGTRSWRGQRGLDKVVEGRPEGRWTVVGGRWEGWVGGRSDWIFDLDQ